MKHDNDIITEALKVAEQQARKETGKLFLKDGLIVGLEKALNEIDSLSYYGSVMPQKKKSSK